MLASNANAVEVFRYCRPDYLMGFGCVLYHGVAATEIRAVAETVEVVCDEDLLWRIRLLDAAYGREINRKNRAGRK